MAQATFSRTRKSLHTRIVEAAAAKDVAVRVTNLEDGRLAYVLTQYGVELQPVTPGAAASMLGVEWPV